MLPPPLTPAHREGTQREKEKKKKEKEKKINHTIGRMRSTAAERRKVKLPECMLAPLSLPFLSPLLLSSSF
jgi:hypothetical protein